GGRDLLRCRKFWGAGVVVLAVLGLRIVTGASLDNLTQNMMQIFAEPVLLPVLLRHHALLDIVRFGPLPALTIAAVAWACFDGWVARATASILAANFIATYACGMSSPGVELAQRVAVFAFGMLLVAMAGAAVLESRVGDAHRDLAGLFTAGV